MSTLLKWSHGERNYLKNLIFQKKSDNTFFLLKIKYSRKRRYSMIFWVNSMNWNAIWWSSQEKWKGSSTGWESWWLLWKLLDACAMLTNTDMRKSYRSKKQQKVFLKIFKDKKIHFPILNNIFSFLHLDCVF